MMKSFRISLLRGLPSSIDAELKHADEGNPSVHVI